MSQIQGCWPNPAIMTKDQRDIFLAAEIETSFICNDCQGDGHEHESDGFGGVNSYSEIVRAYGCEACQGYGLLCISELGNESFVLVRNAERTAHYLARTRQIAKIAL